MKKMMLLFAAVAMTASVCSAAAAVACPIAKVDGNKLTKMRPFNPKADFKLQPDGSLVCVNKDAKSNNGYSAGVTLNQTTPKAITFSAENKAENVSAPDQSFNYGVYLDITYTDGSRTWGCVAPFKTGTHDWEKAEKTFVPKKAIKTISYHILFRNKSGKATFRNAVLTEAK